MISALQWINTGARKLPAWIVYFAGIIPAGLLIYSAITGGLGPDPVKSLEHQLGLLGLQFLVAALLISPLRHHTGINLLKFRRALGVLTFIYATLHFATWLALDIQFNWDILITDILKRPYITFGFLSLVLMIPLAVTSNNAAVRRLGGVAWQRLHLLTYPAAILAGLHFILLTKTWQLEPALYLFGIIGLLAIRKKIRVLAVKFTLNLRRSPR